MSLNKNLSHENYDRKNKVVLGSNRQFGLVMAAVFLFFGFLSLLSKGSLNIYFSGIGFLFLTLAILNPTKLSVLNRLWLNLGLMLGKIFSPVILVILFYLVFLPVGLCLKIFKKDILNLKINKHSASYWIDSTKNVETTMKDQF